MSTNAFSRSGIPETDDLKLKENDERGENVRFENPEVEAAYQNEGSGMKREVFHEYLEVKKTIKPLNIVKRSASSSTAFSDFSAQTVQSSFVPSRRTTMPKWGKYGDDIPVGVPEQIREAMISLESSVRQSEMEFSGSQCQQTDNSLLLPEEESRRLIPSSRSSSQPLGQTDNTTPVAHRRVSELKQNDSRTFIKQPAPQGFRSSAEGYPTYAIGDLQLNRSVTTARRPVRPPNYAVAARQHAQDISRYGLRSTSSSGLTAEEFMATVHRGSQTSIPSLNSGFPPSGATFRGRKYSQGSEFALSAPYIAESHNTVSLASQSAHSVSFGTSSAAPGGLRHSISTTRRNASRFRPSGVIDAPSSQHIKVVKGRRGVSYQEFQPVISDPPIRREYDLSFLPEEQYDPATETQAQRDARKERAMLAYFVHIGVDFDDEAALRRARFAFQRLWEDCGLGPRLFRKPRPRGEITNWM
ncbi:hypothetical protein TWF281_004868 [Arthrobotrys megalospora]